MGKLIKPTKPRIKKPKVPSKPRKPAEYVNERVLSLSRDYSIDNSTFNAMCKVKKTKVGYVDKFRIKIYHDVIRIAVKNPGYKKELEKYHEKMVVYHEKIKKIKPSLDEYEAKMAEYEYKLALYEKEKKEQAYLKARKKAIVAG